MNYPTAENTRELGNGEQLHPDDYIWAQAPCLLDTPSDDEYSTEDEFLPLGPEWDGHILDGSEDYAFVRLIQQPALEGICEQYGIDTELGVCILKILIVASADINHVIKRKTQL
jgi:hypothetical protein